MLIYFLYGVFILACVVLILAVLLQPGKADAGALFTSSISSTAFGPRGTQTLLAKITIGAAIAFMLTALTISFGVGGARSVLQSEQETTAPQATPSPAASPATPQQQEGGAPTPAGQGEGGATDANANASATPEPAVNPRGEASPASPEQKK